MTLSSSEHTVSYAEFEALTIDYSQSEKAVRDLRRKVAALEREQAVTEDSPEAANVIALLGIWWKEVKNSDPRVAHGLESTRAPKVRAALRRRKKVDGGEDQAFDMCRRAILGVNLDDWASGRIKKSGGKTFNDIAEHVLNTDGDIEKFAKLYDDYRKAEPEKPSPPLRLVHAAPYDPLQAVYDRSRQRGLEPNGEVWRFRATCPAHKDGERSLLVIEGCDRRAELHCAQRCSSEEIARALGLPWGALFPEGHRHFQSSGRDVQEAA